MIQVNSRPICYCVSYRTDLSSPCIFFDLTAISKKSDFYIISDHRCYRMDHIMKNIFHAAGRVFLIIKILNMAINTNSTLSDIVQNTLQKEIMTDTNSIYVSLSFTNSIILEGLWSKFFPLFCYLQHF